MAQQHYDLLVLGAGAAGSTAAMIATGRGARVALIERDKLGGTCLNYGCDPTKTLLNIANMLYQSQHAARYGLHIPGVSIEWKTVQAYVREVVTTIRGGTPEEASAEMPKKGIDFFHAEASFISPREISVDGQTLSAERIIIATGSETMTLPIEGLDKTGYITNVEAVSLPSLPRRMAVIGGGAIGIEFAQMFHRFGVEISVLEHAQHLLSTEDRELADMLCDLLSEEGIRMQTSAELQQVRRTSSGKELIYRCGDGPQERLEVDEILLAVGRRPNIEKLNLAAAGVKATSKGIEVDPTLRTNIPHVWAAGDVTSKYQFTHVADEQGKVAVHNAFADKPQPFEGYVIPWVTYTDPPLAHVGSSEEELREMGIEYNVGRVKFSEIERAISNGRAEGLTKLLADREGKILGGHILGKGADDLLAPIVVAMHAGLPASMLASTIIPYPTLSEGVRRAADQLE